MDALSGAVESVARAQTRKRLRVLAYHGVGDALAFERQMTCLRERYAPVATNEVVAALRGDAVLPDYAVWVTFDDGLANVVETGMPIMERIGIRATLFVCPGIVEPAQPFWWDVVEAATAHRVPVPNLSAASSQSPVTALKSVADHVRREVVRELAERLAALSIDVSPTVLTPSQLDRWCDAGNDVGNHTWDHPCLDMCEPTSQRTQIAAADAWLREHVVAPLRVFAYPNGDWTRAAEDVLRELEYDAALLFDHRLASSAQDPLRVSRLRVSTRASDRRFAQIVAGTHSLAYHARRRLSRRPAPDTALRAPI